MPGCVMNRMPVIMRQRGFASARASGINIDQFGDWRNQLSVEPLYPLYMAAIGGEIRGPMHKD